MIRTRLERGGKADKGGCEGQSFQAPAVAVGVGKTLMARGLRGMQPLGR